MNQTIIDTFLLDLDQQIQAKHLLKHVFYQAWSQGKLKKECLKEYAMEYYHHVKAFPTYLSALHAHTDDIRTRQDILQNLIEEEAGHPNHPDLWKNFALSLGVTEKEIEQHQPCHEIQTLIQAFRSICHQEGVAEGLAALYAYESQIPDICLSKIDGLKKYYGMNEPSEWRYFSVHIGADEEHSRVERRLLAKHITQAQISSTHHAVERILVCLWNFLNAMCHKYEIAC